MYCHLNDIVCIKKKTGGEKYGNVAEKLTRIVDGGLLDDDGIETDSGKV